MQSSALLVLALLPCYDASSYRRTKMTFIEEQMSMQMKLMTPERATLNNIEASILNMAKARKEGGDQAATNLTSFLDQIQELIDKTMKANIQTRLLDLQEAGGTLEPSGTCTHPNDTEYVPTLVDLDKLHSQCRSSQDSMWSGYEQTCIIERQIYENEIKAICDKYKSVNVFPNPTTSCMMMEGTKVPTIGNYLLAAEAFFTERYDLVKEWKDKCDNATNTPFANEELCKQKICLYYDKKISCDKTQETFEQKSCDLHKEYTCSKYSDCYDQKKEIYNSVVSLAKENEVAAKAEWRAVKRIECLVNALRSPQGEVEEAINSCKGKIYATTPVELVYKGDAPAARSCTEVYLQPGSAVFSSTWYAGLPSQTPAASCASSCCMAEAFNPTYPDGAACPYVSSAPTTTTTTTESTTTTTTTAAAAAMFSAPVFGGFSFGGLPGIRR
ncbi:unnamed protein product [Symbiodinium natans]|uniref:Uncharacterized protein n=1 Tax=Symbiodinium natans TaxID=878477 RepID=A0A812NHW3_9DINO|nr:unnamed protein product [Symbiodinium natans]